MKAGLFVKALLAALLLLAGCSADRAPQVPDGRVAATLGGVELVLEVADTDAERAVGLMGRTSVPAGTGMVFRYDAPNQGRYYMFQVPIPLRAVFIRSGRVVSSVVMPPCGLQDPAACPTYGADGPFDTVVETDPATLPDIRPGDRFALL